MKDVVTEEAFHILSRLPGKCLGVYMVLSHLSNLQRTRTVVLTNARLAKCGVSRDQKAYALRRLVDAGFIQVSSTNGKNPLVTLLTV